MKSTKYFKKYMLRYVLVCILVILGCIPFAVLSFQHIRDNKMNESITKIESGIIEFENNLHKMRMISSMISDDSNVLALVSVQGNLSPDKQLLLKYIKNQVFDISLIYDYARYFFILFRDNNAFISKDKVTSEYTSFYGEFFEVEDFNAQEFKKYIMQKEIIGKFVPLSHIQFFEGEKKETVENTILFVDTLQIDKSFIGSKAVMGFVLDPEKIVKTLLNSDVSAGGKMIITDNSGQILMSYGDDAEKYLVKKEKGRVQIDGEFYQLITRKNVANQLNIIMAYPLKLVEQELKSIMYILITYAILGIAIAIIVVLLFSKRWFKPVRELLSSIDFSDSTRTYQNEYDAIHDSLLMLVSEKDEMKTKLLISSAQKQAVLLENTFLKGFYRREDEEIFLSQFPIARNDYRVVYIQIYPLEGGDYEMVLLESIEYLKDKLRSGLISMSTMKDTYVLLLPIDQMDEATILNLFWDLIAVTLSKCSVITGIGISQKQEVISNINVAYYQARQTVHAFRDKQSDFVEFYRYDHGDVAELIDLNFNNRFQELLLGACRTEINELFDRIKSECLLHKEKYEMQKAEIFHMLMFVQYSVYKQIHPKNDNAFYKREYQQNHSLLQNMDILRENAMCLCDLIEEKKNDRREILYDRIVDFINHNFKRCELTTEIAASELGISDRYLVNFLKEASGKTFAVYLDEIRIEHAKRCLKDTDWINDRIAQECGFGATNSFYRIFKKYVGVTPSVYKASNMN